jgi:carbamoyltransferase
LQKGSYLGPEFSDDEIEAFLQLHNYPYQKLTEVDRVNAVAKALEKGKVVGHFAGRTEFGPRSLGARSILGDPRNREMQVTLNLKIKYRESFRPFAPTVLAERVSDYFELDRESPYMLLVAPVKEERRIPFNRGNGEDLLEVVRMPRSDIPAITHVDYSARVQSIMHEDHPVYYDVLKAFSERTGCGVLVNTSFNVRGEPIVNTPQDAYRCFMRTEMDVLVLGNYLLLKEEQPPWPEERGHIDEYTVTATAAAPDFLAALTQTYEKTFLPLVHQIKANGYSPLCRPFKERRSTWEDYTGPSTPKAIFLYPNELLAIDDNTANLEDAITQYWSNQELAKCLKPVLAQLVKIGRRFAVNSEFTEEVSDSIYVMF